LIHGATAPEAAALGAAVAALVGVAVGAVGVDLEVEGLVVGGLELVWAPATTAIVAINRIKKGCFIVVEILDWYLHGSLSGRSASSMNRP
jgi:hypothetical protein